MKRLALLIPLVACDDGSSPAALAAPDAGGVRDAQRPADAARLRPDATLTDTGAADAVPPADAQAVRPDAAPPRRDAALPRDAAAPADAAPAADAAPSDAGVPPELEVVRFAALGDVGKGNTGQLRVGAALAQICEARGGCDFALLLGDNIYDAGAADADDPQWQEKFEIPYQDADFPFYATLGNHDYGAPDVLVGFAGGLGIDPARGQAQLDYAARQDKFRMPDAFYRFERGPVEVVSINTATLFWRDLDWVEALTGYNVVNARQEAEIPQWNAASQAPWRIAFSHHPYLSNGRHGNAGMYDWVLIEGLIGSGTGIRDFFREHVLGEFDVLITGHDHSLQDLGRVEGTHLIVSGAGASTTEVAEDRNDFVFQSEELGFVLVEADARRLTFDFYLVAEAADAEQPWRLAHTRTIRH